MEFEPVIGLEIHVQLKTLSKMFCFCAQAKEDAAANTNICPVCTGQPGALPVLNPQAVKLAIAAGAALNCQIRPVSVFARKNYFYPDLPKAYQISQYDKPICEDGFVELETGKKIRIKRAHLEEDAAKSLHAMGSQKLDYTIVDFNRSSAPLLEIVSEPDISGAQEAYDYLIELKKLLKWINASNCDMEKGELRCDVNVSVKPKGSQTLGTKVEIKNLNSFKAAKDAINYEIKRQSEMITKDEKIAQDTRLWNEKEQTTAPMRSKEMAHDYRYFPEPDLPPLFIKDEEINSVKSQIGKLPGEIKKEYRNNYGLSFKDAGALCENKFIHCYFENLLALKPQKQELNHCVNLILGPVFAKINELKIDETDLEKKLINPQNLLKIASLLDQNKVSASSAKKLIDICFDNSRDPLKATEEEGLLQSNDEGEMEIWVKEAVELNKQAFEDFKNGNEKAVGPIVGFVMKKSKGKANPKTVNDILKKIK